MKTTPERHQEQLPAYPCLRWGEGSANNSEFRQKVKVTQQSIFTGTHSSSGTILSGSSGERFPILPPLHCRSEMDLGSSTPNNLGADPAPTGQWQAQTKEEAWSISCAGSGHYNICHSSYQGDNGQHTQKKQAVGIHIKKQPSHQKILNSHRLHRVIPT